MKSLFFFISSLFILNVSMAQFGPGGVGTTDGSSSLKMWYQPGITLDTNGSLLEGWTNSAGVSNHDMASSGLNRPTVLFQSLNGYDVVNFVSNDFLETTGALSTSNFVVNQASSYIVTRRTGNSSNWPYGTFPQQQNRFTCHIPWSNGTVYFDIGNCCTSSARIQVGGQSNFGDYSYWSYDALSSSGKQLYRNGTLLQNRANTSTYSSHSSHQFRLGQNFRGEIAEVIIFNQKVNTAQRIIIENYLSAKYNIVAASNDIYVQDDVANGDYDHDVAGIGRLNASNLHDDAQGTGMVRVLNPSDLDNDEYLFWGHDNGGTRASNNTDVPPGVQARFDRVWRVSEVDQSGSAVDVGSIDIQFDLNGLGPVTPADLLLLVDTDNDGIFANESPADVAIDLGGGIYEFPGITDISDGNRFTIGTIDVLKTPLPIELIKFEAQVVDKSHVKIVWQTATEKNNEKFEVEKSTDQGSWNSIGEVYGAGNSNTIKNYSIEDQHPFPGTSYYRLKDIDMFGHVTYSNIEVVHLDMVDKFPYKIYPNPAESEIFIEGEGIQDENFRIYHISGQDKTNSTSFRSEGFNKIRIDIKSLESGLYFVKTSSHTYELRVK